MSDNEIIKFLSNALEHEIEENSRLWYVVGYQESAIEHKSGISAAEKFFLQQMLRGEIDPFDAIPEAKED